MIPGIQNRDLLSCVAKPSPSSAGGLHMHNLAMCHIVLPIEIISRRIWPSFSSSKAEDRLPFADRDDSKREKHSIQLASYLAAALELRSLKLQCSISTLPIDGPAPAGMRFLVRSAAGSCSGTGRPTDPMSAARRCSQCDRDHDQPSSNLRVATARVPRA